MGVPYELRPANCLSLRFIEEVFFAADDFAVLHVDAGDTARDVAHDFVVDGATDWRGIGGALAGE